MRRNNRPGDATHRAIANFGGSGQAGLTFRERGDDDKNHEITVPYLDGSILFGSHDLLCDPTVQHKHTAASELILSLIYDVFVKEDVANIEGTSSVIAASEEEDIADVVRAGSACIDWNFDINAFKRPWRCGGMGGG